MGPPHYLCGVERPSGLLCAARPLCVAEYVAFTDDAQRQRRKVAKRIALPQKVAVCPRDPVYNAVAYAPQRVVSLCEPRGKTLAER